MSAWLKNTPRSTTADKKLRRALDEIEKEIIEKVVAG